MQDALVYGGERLSFEDTVSILSKIDSLLMQMDIEQNKPSPDNEGHAFLEDKIESVKQHVTPPQPQTNQSPQARQTAQNDEYER